MPKQHRSLWLRQTSRAELKLKEYLKSKRSECVMRNHDADLQKVATRLGCLLTELDRENKTRTAKLDARSVADASTPLYKWTAFSANLFPIQVAGDLVSLTLR